MDTQDRINSMLREISYKIGLGLPNLDKNGVCAMRYNDKFNFIMEVPEGSDHLFFYSPLVVHQEGHEQIFKKLLRHNFLCMDTEGATFAIDKENDDIVLCRIHVIGTLDALRLETIINEFLTTADKWNRKLRQWLRKSRSGQQQTRLEDVPSNQLSSMA